MKTDSYLAIIPARGGSKGVPRKNIRPIAGKPLIAWTILQARQSEKIDRVIVSTDDDEVAAVAIQYGAEVPFMRPREIATDNATTEASLLHAVAWLEQNEGYRPDNVVLLQCTSPIRSPGVIDGAIATFESETADSLLSATEFWHFLWSDKSAPRAGYDFRNRPRRQDISETHIRFKENGSIYVTSLAVLIGEQNRLGGKIAMFLMDEHESFEIDTEADFALVECILKMRQQ